MKRTIRRVGFGETLVVEMPKGGKITITNTGHRGDKVNLGVDTPSDAFVYPADKLDSPRDTVS